MGLCGIKKQKNVSARNWTHKHLVKQKVDFQLKLHHATELLRHLTEIDSLLLLNWNLNVFISILLMQVQDGKSKQKWQFVHKPLNEF